MELILKGVGVCTGSVKGKAKIITDLTKVPEIEEGTILIALFFTPLMSIAISKAAAVLTDFGGITSHIAVVAREFNIPCIVGLNEITTKVKDGQMLHIDGETGEIYGI